MMDIKDFLEWHLQEIVKHGKSHSVLLFEGEKAKKTLKEIDNKLRLQGYETNWVEHPKNEKSFWIEVLGGANLLSEDELNIEDTHKLGKKTIALFRDRSKDHYLLIPDIEKVFFAHPFIDNLLRTIWSIPESKFNIYATIFDSKSQEYKNTIGDYYFPFNFHNFIFVKA